MLLRTKVKEPCQLINQKEKKLSVSIVGLFSRLRRRSDLDLKRLFIR